MAKIIKKILKKTDTTNNTISFPTVLLKQWLIGRKYWNHNDWLSLLDDLRNQGYSGLVDSEAGRTSIGQFLETEREK